MLDKFLTFTKTVSCLVIRTAQKIDTKLMHPFEKFLQNLFVKVYSMKDFNFLTHELKQIKFYSGFLVVQNIGSLKPCHVLLKQSSENVFVSRQKDYWAQIHDMLINEEPLGQVNF